MAEKKMPMKCAKCGSTMHATAGCGGGKKKK